MTSDRIRKKITRNVLRKRKKIHTLVELFEAMNQAEDKQMRYEIAEAIAEMIYPDGIARVAEVYHPNGLVS
jgi:hypothetical protein